jgi:hypothetical protein
MTQDFQTLQQNSLARRLRVWFSMRSLDFSIDLILQPHYGPGVDSASNRNEYQESSWGVKGGRHMKLTTSLPAVSQMWEPRHLTTLWAFMTCYRDSFTFYLFRFIILETVFSKLLHNMFRLLLINALNMNKRSVETNFHLAQKRSL